MSFESLGLSPSIIEHLNNQKITTPYPIQKQAIPLILEREDVLGIAKTGSGKTLSYCLPLLMNLQKKKVEENRHITTLILVPTRELAIQVQEVFEEYTSLLPTKIKSMAVYGGVSINPQMIKMQGVHVLIATPGRLLDLLDSKAMNLSKLHSLVLDEADKMLNLGFQEEMNRIIKLLPEKRQNLLFSATLSQNVKDITQLVLKDPKVLTISTEEEVNIDSIEQIAYFIDDAKKGPLLRALILNNKMKKVLVFASSTYKADHISDKLRKNGIEATAIHGKKSQTARNEALRRFKNGNLRVLVATDLLARGIDIDYLPCVINYELPRSPKDYVHRIGRTGRADKTGQAFSLISEEEMHHFKVIQKKMKVKVELLDGDDIINA